jgi:hypothetical protein
LHCCPPFLHGCPLFCTAVLSSVLLSSLCTVLLSSIMGTPTKRQVSKRQGSKRPVSKRLERQFYKTSGIQNVRFTKCQVYKTSGLQNVRLQKTAIYILYLWLVEIRRFCCSHVCSQSDGSVLFSILEGFFAISHHNR